MKKILALCLSLCLVIGCVLPVSGLSDIAGTVYETAIRELVDYGVFTGYLDTNTFKPENTITRAEACTAIIRAMNLEKEALANDKASAFSDMNTPNVAWARPYVNKAEEVGIVEGDGDGTMQPGRLLKLDEIITMLLRALQVEYTEGTGSYWYLNAMLKAQEIGLIASGISTPENPVNRGTVAQLIHTAIDLKLPDGSTWREGLDAAKVFAIEKVEAVGQKALRISFTAAVDEVKAKDIANYRLSFVTTGEELPLSAATVEDSRTVLLHQENPVNRGSSCLIAVGDVTSAAGEALSGETTLTVNFNDTQAPQLTQAEILGAHTLVLYFNEPVESITSITLSRGEVTAYELSGDGMKAVCTVDEDMTAPTVVDETGLAVAAPELTVTVDGARDYWRIVSEKMTVTAKSGKTIAFGFTSQEAVVNDDECSVKVTLNKDVELTNSLTALAYNTVSTRTASSVAVENGNTLVVKFSEENFKAYENGLLVLPTGLVKDAWGNVNPNMNMVFTVVIDDVAPTVTGAELDVMTGVITVTFSETVKAVADSNLTLIDTAGNTVTRSAVTFDGDKTATFTLPADYVGTFTLTVAGVEDLYGNALAENFEKSFTLSEKIEPKFTDFRAYLYFPGEKGQMVRVDFGQPMMQSGKYAVTDLENYIVQGHNLVTLNKTMDIRIESINDGSGVLIYIPSVADNATAGVDLGNVGTVEIGRVANIYGQYTEDMTGELDLSYAKGVSIESAKAIDKNTIVVEFNDKLTEIYANDMRFKTASGKILGYKSYVVDENAYGKTRITYTTRYALDAEGSYKDSKLSAYMVNDRTLGQYGTKMEVERPVAVQDGISASVLMKNGGYEAYRTSETTITFIFDEAINGKTLSTLTFQVDNAEVTDVKTATSYKANDSVVLTIKPLTGMKDDAQVKVNLDFTDMSGTYYTGLKEFKATKLY